VHLWRAIGSLQRQASSSGGREGLAQRYQQLVELHLRDRMSIEAYAAQLGVTRDRLTEACNHVVGMPPQAILHARLVDEARHRLQHSAVSIEQVSYSLGFRDPAYFNRFFTRMTGATPGAFRKAARNARPAEANSFAAWP
jgi:AraC-like DNA-binding protein